MTTTATITIETPCVATREHNGYHDSDFEGTFYVNGKFVTKIVGSTASAGGFVPRINASPEIMQKYREYWEASRQEFNTSLEKIAARVIVKGSRVRVDRPRAKAHGVTGEVVWIGEDRYRSNHVSTYYRIGISPDGGGDRVFVPIGYAVIDVGGTWEEAVSQREIEMKRYAWAITHPQPGSQV